MSCPAQSTDAIPFWTGWQCCTDCRVGPRTALLSRPQTCSHSLSPEQSPSGRRTTRKKKGDEKKKELGCQLALEKKKGRWFIPVTTEAEFTIVQAVPVEVIGFSPPPLIFITPETKLLSGSSSPRWN